MNVGNIVIGKDGYIPIQSMTDTITSNVDDTVNQVELLNKYGSDLVRITVNNIDAAKSVGTLIAERAKAAGINEVSFDRSGYKYHGRVKALADSAREAGLKF